jgi:polysaccharide biosynthesis/export protein
MRKAVWGSAARMRHGFVNVVAAGCAVLFAAVAGAQTPAPVAPVPQPPPQAAPAGVTPPAGYVIGADDVLTIVFWREKDMSADVIVRPDGKISLPLLNEIQAAGLTPTELRAQLMHAATKSVKDPNVTVQIKEIRSRKVFITGNVAKPGTFPLMGDMNVLQLIALAGGLQEYADSKNIVIMRTEGGKQRSLKFNYKDVVKQKHVEQNVLLKPGDVVIVP